MKKWEKEKRKLSLIPPNECIINTVIDDHPRSRSYSNSSNLSDDSKSNHEYDMYMDIDDNMCKDIYRYIH